MSWSAKNADFDIGTFLDYLRSTKPPYYCPYPDCETDGKRKVYKSFGGMQTHLNKQHSGEMDNRGRADDDGEGGGGVSAAGGGMGTQRGLPWSQAQKVVEVDWNGTLWRLNIMEPLQVIAQRDPDLPSPLKSSAVNKEYKEAVKVSGDLPVVKYEEAKGWKLISPQSPLPNAYIKHGERSPSEQNKEIEYDMDEEDYAWLKDMNGRRRGKGLQELGELTFEFMIDRLEKESHWETKRGGPIDEDALCCVCQDGECQNTNVILFCDMCNLAVHQECYGIPYIPEGQWLCRRCQLSPSAAVKCTLCPNGGGAFKQTSDGRWAHVICAIWVPEVHFANTVFLEPIEGMDTVPPARWKLKCVVCKQRGVGACIQCNKPSCYTPFHVTCAQSAGVYMKVEPITTANGDTTPYGVRKFIYCHLHAPNSPNKNPSSAEFELGRNPGPEELAARKHLSVQKMKKARKILAQSRNSEPNIAKPAIPLRRLEWIAGRLNLEGEVVELVESIVAYWMLKRESRFGVPLLRRLQCQKNKIGVNGNITDNEDEDGGSAESQELRAKIKKWRRCRQDLERLRILCELTRKREKLKLEYMNLSEELVGRLMQPDGNPFLDAVNRIMEKDRFKVFEKAVREEDVPGYSTIIRDPMDLGTMKEKATKGQYKSWGQVHNDFKLMINNCLKFNKNNATFFKYGLRMKRLGSQVLRHGQEGISAGTGGLSSGKGSDGIGKSNSEVIRPMEALERDPLCIAHAIIIPSTSLTSKFPVKRREPRNSGGTTKSSELSAPSNSEPLAVLEGDHDADKRTSPSNSPATRKTTAAAAAAAAALNSSVTNCSANASSSTKSNEDPGDGRPCDLSSSASSTASTSTKTNKISGSSFPSTSRNRNSSSHSPSRKRQSSGASCSGGVDISSSAPQKDHSVVVGSMDAFLTIPSGSAETTVGSSKSQFTNPSSSSSKTNKSREENRHSGNHNPSDSGSGGGANKKDSAHKSTSSTSASSHIASGKHSSTKATDRNLPPRKRRKDMLDSGQMSILEYYAPKPESPNSKKARKGNSQQQPQQDTTSSSSSLKGISSGRGNQSNGPSVHNNVISNNNNNNNNDSGGVNWANTNGGPESNTNSSSSPSSSSTGMGKESFKRFRHSESINSPGDCSSAADSEREDVMGERGTQRQPSPAYASSAEETGEEDGYLMEHPKPLDMVWAPMKMGKKRGQVYLPALVMDPGMSSNVTKGGIQIEAPPKALVQRDPNRAIQDEHELRILLRFFDENLSWDWVPFIDLLHFKILEDVDQTKLKEGATHEEVKAAYDKAIMYRCTVLKEPLPSEISQRVGQHSPRRCSLS